MDVVFSVCIVKRGAVCARVWEVCVCRHADVVCVVSCVHPVVVLNAAFCMTCSLLMNIICNTLQSPIYFTSGQKFTPLNHNTSLIISSLSNTPARSNSE